MELIDTHCHLFLEEFDGDRHEVVAAARQAGVSCVVMPNVDSSTLQRMKDTQSAHPCFCHLLVGLHPTSVNESFRDELAIVERELTSGNFAGVGEIGIDLYWDKKFLAQQVEAFTYQLQLAHRAHLPVAIHVRDAFNETFDAVRQSGTSGLKGVFHCFSGSVEQAHAVVEMGYMLGIGGVVTFKNGGLDKVISEIDLDKILLETDSPYLAPAPHRGKRNEPAMIQLVAQKIAIIKNIPLDEVARRTTANARQLFKIARELAR